MAKTLTKEDLELLLQQKVVVRLYSGPYIVDTLTDYNDHQLIFARLGVVEISNLRYLEKYKD